MFVRRCFIRLSGQGLVQPIDRAAKVGNGYRAADNQRHIKRVEELGPGNTRAYALFDVIRDAVVAAQHYRSDQTEQFFGALVERPIFVGLRVEREESFDAEMIAAQQLFIHVGAVTIEFVH